MHLIRNTKVDDLKKIQDLLVDAFSHGRKLDGYVVTHVPRCRIDFLRMYLDECPEGAFVAEKDEEIIGAIFSHMRGELAWIGPLAVATRMQRQGMGKELTLHALRLLKKSGCKTIGLETNPRSFVNLGFYSKMDFRIQSLTFDLISELEMNSHSANSSCQLIKFSECLDKDEEKEFFANTRTVFPGNLLYIDYQSAILTTDKNHYGDSILFQYNQEPAAFAILHTKAPSFEEHEKILRVVSLVFKKKVFPELFSLVLNDLHCYANEKGHNRIMLRMPANYYQILQYLLEKKFVIINSDIRLTLNHFDRWFEPDTVILERWL